MSHTIYHFVLKSGSGLVLKKVGVSDNYVDDEFIDSYFIIGNINGEVYKCYLRDDFISKNANKLPVYYINIITNVNKKKSLMRIFIYFVVNGNIQYNICMDGKYIVEMDYDNETIILDELDEIKNMRKFLENLKEFTTNREMKEIIIKLYNNTDNSVDMSKYNEPPKITYTNK